MKLLTSNYLVYFIYQLDKVRNSTGKKKSYILFYAINLPFKTYVALVSLYNLTGSVFIIRGPLGV